MRWPISSLSAVLLLAASVNALPPNIENDKLDIHRRQQSPCAQLSEALTGDTVPAQIALSCLRSVPLQNETNAQQLEGLRIFLQFQSDLSYLNNSQPARLYPDVDILGGLDSLQERLSGSYYSNEYDFQADVASLLWAAYDGHLVYVPDIVSAFSFARLSSASARPYELFSVSSDGTSLPSVYARADQAALSQDGDAGYEPSPITQINGRDVEDFLNEHAALTGSLHDPDANYNNLFPNILRRRNIPFAPGSFEQFPFLRGPAEETVFTFDNGTDVELPLFAAAASSLDLSGLSDGEDFFERCCGASLLDDLPDPPTTSPSKRGVARDALRQFLDDEKLGYLRNDERRNTRSTWDAHMVNTLQTRQSGLSPTSPFPSPVTGLTDGSIAGYFPTSIPDLAVLSVASFSPSGNPFNATARFQAVVRDFLDSAGSLGKTRLMIDLRGNRGGYGFLAQDLFRQLFPEEEPYDGANYRANQLFDLTGQVVSGLYEDITPADLLPPTVAEPPTLFSGAFPYNYQQQNDINNESFSSWEDFYGPYTVPSNDEDEFTAIVRPDLDDLFQTAFPVYPLGRSVVADPVFAPANITLLQDGICASACALFAEFMKMNLPGGEPVQSIVVGGRPQEGPMQAAGGVKGGQLVEMILLAASTLFALEAGSLAQQLEFASVLGEEELRAVLTTLDRAYTETSFAQGINFRNQIREGDDSVLPLQYVYDAADCRFFYTAAMYGNQELVWERAYQNAFEDGDCVAGSEGHPSAGRTTDYESIEVPENAASSFTVGLSSGEGGREVEDGPGVNGTTPGAEDENASSRTGLGGFAMMLVCSSVLFSML